MALFDKDNPGKNLTNATLWLESSSDSGGSGGSGCSLGACIAVIVAIVAVLFLASALATCVAHALM